MKYNRDRFLSKAIVCFLLIIGVQAFSQKETEVNLEYQFLKSESIAQDKLFYFYTVIQKNPSIEKIFTNNKYLKKVLRDQKESISKAADTCGVNSECHFNTFYWSKKAVDKVSKELKKMFLKHVELKNLVKNDLRASGNFEKYAALNDQEFLLKIWIDTCKGLNNIIDVYGKGVKPLYAKIDSIGYDKTSVFYNRLMDVNVNSIANDLEKSTLFFEPSLQMALNLLEINDRNEIEIHEPMHEKENKLAVKHLKNINWEQYKYSLILVPGFGPEEEKVALSPMARFRLKLAVERYQKKMAPIIVVSGGGVHPYRTVFNEAVEMKKSLMNDYGIPEKDILIEPHARHTTTNLRNTARLMYRYGIPSDKKGLITTTKYQSAYITRSSFNKRCLKELEYIPVEIGKRLNKNDIEFLPKIISLHTNNIDPLDP
ncbi:YdcF family protein [Wenyingzhuangia sp. 1_MG-2023]|nr:YdcF family protein [Wenyingzhuangia sp. 1_MG-2023]